MQNKVMSIISFRAVKNALSAVQCKWCMHFSYFRFRFLTITVRGWTIVLVEEITDTFSCFSSPSRSTWLPYSFSASFTCFTNAKIWLNRLFWSPSSLWPLYPYYSSLSLASRDSTLFWWAEVGPPTSKWRANSVEDTILFPKVAVITAATLFVDHSTQGT